MGSRTGLGHKRPGVLAATARQCPTAADHAQGDTNFASPRTEAGIDAIRRLATARSSNPTREVLVQPEDEVRRRLSRVGESVYLVVSKGGGFPSPPYRKVVLLGDVARRRGSAELNTGDGPTHSSPA